MKIAYIVETLSKGGAERVVSNLSCADSEKHYIITVFDEKTYAYKGIYQSLNLKRSNNILDKLLYITRLRKGLKKILLEKKFDVVISNGVLLNSIVADIETKTKKIIVEHSIFSFYDKNIKQIIFKRLAKKKYSKADKIICVSKGAKKALIEVIGVKESKIIVINNPFSISNIVEESKKTIDIFEKQKYNIVTAGRLSESKGQWYIVNIAKKMPDDICIYIIGDGKLKDKLQNKIKKNNLENKIILIPFASENFYSYLANADLFILPSKRESFGNVIVEAFITRTPVISSKCNGEGPLDIFTKKNRNLSCNNYDVYSEGILIDKFDLENDFEETTEYNKTIEKKFIEAIKFMKNNPVIVKEIIDNAFKRAQAFNSEVILKMYKKEICNVVSEKDS